MKKDINLAINEYKIIAMSVSNYTIELSFCHINTPSTIRCFTAPHPIFIAAINHKMYSLRAELAAKGVSYVSSFATCGYTN